MEVLLLECHNSGISGAECRNLKTIYSESRCKVRSISSLSNRENSKLNCRASDFILQTTS